MEATQTDIDYPQPTGQEDGTVDGIVNGIMDQLEGDPNVGGLAVSRADAAEEPEQAEAEPETDEPEKYTIKWQGKDKEVTQDELLDLAQKGFDYTQKTQQLAEERNQLAPYQGLANTIQNNPLLANQIAALISGKAPQQAPQAPKFDDPIEQLKWEVKQEAKAEFQAEMQRNIEPLHRQQALNSVKSQVQADPDYAVVHQQIIDMVKSQPPSIQKTLYLQLDQDPNAYVEAFQQFKQRLHTSTSPPKALKRETKAPILESGGVAAPEGIEGKAKQERISKMKAKALRQGDPSAIADWLGASGALDHLY
jgi:hypothetical protein